MHNTYYLEAIKNLKLDNAHPFHLAILEECCETATLHTHDISNSTAIAQSIHIAFLSSVSIWGKTLEAAFKNTDQLAIELRGQRFLLDHNILLLTTFLQHIIKLSISEHSEAEEKKGSKIINFSALKKLVKF
jgi:hypothetical protein